MLRGVANLLLRALARLPLPALHAVGAILGWAIYGISPTYRRHVRENLAQAGYAHLRRAALAAAGQMFVELPAIWLRDRDDVLRWVARIEGRELIDAARAEGRGIMVLTPHLGCFEVVGQALAEIVPLTALYRRPKLAFLQPLIEQGRAKRDVHLAPADLSGVRELLAALKRREAVGILPDQAPGAGEGEWVEFFGRPAYTMTLASKLAARPDVVPLLVYGERLARGRGYIVHVRPFPPALPNESELRRLNRALEALIAERPEQYLWGYNRYKVPRGAKPPGQSGAP